MGTLYKALWVCPASIRKSVLNRSHGTVHHEQDRMCRRIINDYRVWWPKMEKDISIHTQSCVACQHIKDGEYTKWKKTGKVKLFQPTRPFEQISVNLVGPLPTSYSGHRYIVSMIDRFSRQTSLIPVPDMRAITPPSSKQSTIGFRFSDRRRVFFLITAVNSYPRCLRIIDETMAM